MSDYNRRLGQYGEQLAAQFLIKRGCLIIAKNFRTRFGEIDLIAQAGDEILFVEVKTRTASTFGYPEYAVDHQKISHLVQAARAYLEQNSLNSVWRLEIISIELNKQAKTAKIKRFQTDY
jgi:putative endonuclease